MSLVDLLFYLIEIIGVVEVLLGVDGIVLSRNFELRQFPVYYSLRAVK